MTASVIIASRFAICNRCGEYKSLGDFPPEARSRRVPTCRECISPKASALSARKRALISSCDTDSGVERALHYRLAISIRRRNCAISISDLGFSMGDLRVHLERQFSKGMTWNKFCSGAIHIDHIRPLAQFDLTDVPQAREAWSLTNLRPLWGQDNLVKGGERLFLI